MRVDKKLLFFPLSSLVIVVGERVSERQQKRKHKKKSKRKVKSLSSAAAFTAFYCSKRVGKREIDGHEIHITRILKAFPSSQREATSRNEKFFHYYVGSFRSIDL